jgi:hypothetical protein
MLEVNQALYQALSAALAGEVGDRIFPRQAPEGTATPYVVYFKSGGSHRYTFRRRVMRSMPYVVKVVDAGWDNENAHRIDALIDQLLTDGAFDGTILAGGGKVQDARREGDLEYQEDDEPGAAFQHVGGVYRVVVSLP